jgi:sugar phosphate isomerase/epimerase
MTNHYSRRNFFRTGPALAISAASALADPPAAPPTAPHGAIERIGGPALKVSLNAYSFSKLLNDFNKQRGGGISLLELLDFCAKNNFEGIDPTGYFFPGYPEVPADKYVNNLKRRAFELGLGISGTGVRNNFTTSDKAVRDAGVQHIKQWVEVAARLGAPVLRVFADTQRKNMTWHDVAKDCTRDQVQQWIVEDLSQCAEKGEQFGVIIGVQNHGDFLQTGDQLLTLIRGVNSPWCGAIVDTGYFKTKDPYKDMEQVAPYAVNWQIKQAPFGQESEIRTDLSKLIRIIRASNYRGYLPIETLSSKEKAYDPFTVVPAFQKELRAAIRVAS